MAYGWRQMSRFIFLLFIVILSVYFIYVNKNVTQNHESFAQNDFQSRVHGMYVDLFKKEPSNDEMKFYIANYQNSGLNDQQLSYVIFTTAPIIEKSVVKQPVESNYGTEDEVIVTFNQILNRNPTADELVMYAKMWKTDPKFNQDKLILILTSTDEYKRFEKIQTNEVNGTLLGGVTERQIALTVENMYAQATGKQIDQDTQKFLHKKFVEYKLDEKKLKDFLTNYVIGNGIVLPKTQVDPTALNNMNAKLADAILIAEKDALKQTNGKGQTDVLQQMNSNISKAIFKVEKETLNDIANNPQIATTPPSQQKQQNTTSQQQNTTSQQQNTTSQQQNTTTTLQNEPSTRLNELDPNYLRNLEYTYEEKYHETQQEVEQEFKQVPWYILTQDDLKKAQLLKETFVQGPTNQDTVNCLLRTSFPNGYKQSEYLLESQSMIDTILSRGNMVFNKNNSSNTSTSSPTDSNTLYNKNFDTSSLEKERTITLLADEIAKRNMDNLNNSCKRDVFL